jgi:hypothetical protein
MTGTAVARICSPSVLLERWTWTRRPRNALAISGLPA